MIIYTKDHKEIVGATDGKPYRVLFDEEGYAEVEEAVGDQLVQLQAAVRVDDEAPEGDNVDLEKLNVPQLRKYAREHEIDLGEATKKVEILEKINGAQKAAENQE